jgi:1,4-dihydroxy-2-naphthoate octaprenyltransferase
MTDISVNELKSSPHWTLLAKLNIDGFLGGVGHHLTTMFVVGLLFIFAGIFLRLNQYPYSEYGFGVGAILDIVAIGIYVFIASKKLKLAMDLFELDKDTKILQRSRKLIEHYAPDEGKSIDWVAVARIYEGSSNYGALIPLITALNSVSLKFKG